MPPNNVEVVLRNACIARKFNVSLDDNDTIASLKWKLHEKSGVRTDTMKVVFCGQNLSDETKLESLRLSPLTNLTVITKRKDEFDLANPQDVIEVSDINLPVMKLDCTYNSFFVFCKKCNGMHRANHKDGKTFLDSSKKLKIDCKECESGQTASIIFKCVECGEGAIPLTEVRTNLDKRLKCEICDEGEFEQCITLDCGHNCCISCFVSYCEQTHAQRNFIRKAKTGLTITCPVYLCPGYVKDIHHFYLMGVDAYQRFQKQATEIFVVQQIEAQYCPQPKCGATFFVDEEYADEATVLCPECLLTFCRYCKQFNTCKCSEKIVDASLETINRTSKVCPKCRVHTERSGGCAHIRCTQCNYDWCFVCGEQWTSDCQWDHWFQ